VRIDQHPLAYLIGLEGLALLRAFTGEYDRAFTEARLAEIRELLDGYSGRGGPASEITTTEGYGDWAPRYDRPGNALIDAEGPIVRDLVARLPVGVALDAACGTGRHAAYLSSIGHKVIGVDSNLSMLAHFSGTRALGALERLPLAPDSVDLVVCGLALSHCHSLPPVFAEFARVLRPGGHLIVSDTRGLPSAPWFPMVRRPGVMMARVHSTSAFLNAALPVGLSVRDCIEPLRGADYADRALSSPPAPRPDGEPPNIYDLHRRIPAAVAAAYRDTAALIVLHFQLSGAGEGGSAGAVAVGDEAELGAGVGG
jgi:SAM-dependent methyltransferase